MHYQSLREARANYFKLQVGDTFNSGTKCTDCGQELIGFYDATAALPVPRHNSSQCTQYLTYRIQELESKLVNLALRLDHDTP